MQMFVVVKEYHTIFWLFAQFRREQPNMWDLSARLLNLIARLARSSVRVTAFTSVC
jgi:hypothetical protein